ncbi:MAG: PDZ domain-containing protein, partial [Planctomycetota bacterium]
MDELIAALGSPRFVERELAAHALQNRNDVTLADLEAALLVDELSLEQRRRLSAAAKLRFETEPRAAMGITLGQMTDLGLPITGTTEGFDSTNWLRGGDIITSIDGVDIRSLEDLQVSIIANAPGARVPVRFIREGAAMEAEVEL